MFGGDIDDAYWFSSCTKVFAESVGVAGCIWVTEE